MLDDKTTQELASSAQEDLCTFMLKANQESSMVSKRRNVHPLCKTLLTRKTKHTTELNDCPPKTAFVNKQLKVSNSQSSDHVHEESSFSATLSHQVLTPNLSDADGTSSSTEESKSAEYIPPPETEIPPKLLLDFTLPPKRTMALMPRTSRNPYYLEPIKVDRNASLPPNPSHARESGASEEGPFESPSSPSTASRTWVKHDRPTAASSVNYTLSDAITYEHDSNSGVCSDGLWALYQNDRLSETEQSFLPMESISFVPRSADQTTHEQNLSLAVGRLASLSPSTIHEDDVEKIFRLHKVESKCENTKIKDKSVQKPRSYDIPDEASISKASNNPQRSKSLWNCCCYAGLSLRLIRRKGLLLRIALVFIVFYGYSRSKTLHLVPVSLQRNGFTHDSLSTSFPPARSKGPQQATASHHSPSKITFVEKRSNLQSEAPCSTARRPKARLTYADSCISLSESQERPMSAKRVVDKNTNSKHGFIRQLWRQLRLKWKCLRYCLAPKP